MIFSFGTRNSFGLFLEPVSTFYEWERTIFATAIAVQNLIWGLSQPFFGGLADRYGENKILSIGAFLYFVGILGMALCTTEQGLYLTLGLLCGIGLSGASITIVIAAVTKVAPTNRRSFFFGLNYSCRKFGSIYCSTRNSIFNIDRGLESGGGNPSHYGALDTSFFSWLQKRNPKGN